MVADKCPDCDGTGSVEMPPAAEELLSKKPQTSDIPAPAGEASSESITQMPCPRCNGTGRASN
jgi:DnaJ-class molecular chaperone